MKALTLYQPHAFLIGIGAKLYETRSWKTNFRGLLAIHAGHREEIMTSLLEAISPTAAALLGGEDTGAEARQGAVDGASTAAREARALPKQLVLMPRKGIVRTERHQVHAVRCADGKPLCGGGHKATYVVMWQDDIGPVNCEACLTILEHKAKGKA